MVESLIIGLVLIFGYVEPLYKCLKITKMNEPDTEQLLFWCKHWIVFVWLTVCERIANTFIAWVPLFDEAKLVIFLYLCFNRTKGTTYIYESLLRPYLLKHVKMIDHFPLKMNTKALLYYKKAGIYGWTGIYEILQHFRSLSFPPAPAQSQCRGSRVQSSRDEQCSSLPFDTSSSADELQEDAREQNGASEKRSCFPFGTSSSDLQEDIKEQQSQCHGSKVQSSRDEQCSSLPSDTSSSTDELQEDARELNGASEKRSCFPFGTSSSDLQEDVKEHHGPSEDSRAAFAATAFNEQTRATPAHEKIEKSNDKPKAKSHKPSTELKGGRRMVWIVLALLSGSSALNFLLIPQVEQIVLSWKVKDWDRLRTGIILAVTFMVAGLIYASFLEYLAYSYKIKPLALPPFLKSFFRIVLILTCPWLEYLVEDYWKMLFWFAVCFHVIPLFNLLGSCENFGLLDCLPVLLIELVVVYPKYANHVVAVSFVAFVRIMLYYEHQREQLAEKENVVHLLAEKEDLSEMAADEQKIA